MSTLDKCRIRDFPEPQGSIKYRDASTMPRTQPGTDSASGCSTDVSTTIQPPLVRSVFHDLRISIIFPDYYFIVVLIYIIYGSIFSMFT